MKKIRQTYNNQGDAPDGRMVCPKCGCRYRAHKKK